MLESWVDLIWRATRELEAQMKKTNVKAWAEKQRRMHHRCAGHVVRMSDARRTNKLLNWLPQMPTGRRHTRLRKRWSDDPVAHDQLVTEQKEICWRFQTYDLDDWRASLLNRSESPRGVQLSVVLMLFLEEACALQ